MSYCADQYDCNFKFRDGMEESARKAALKTGALDRLKGFGKTASLEEIFFRYGWDGYIDMLRNSSNIDAPDVSSFFDVITPYVEDGSYVVMIGEDLKIWRWLFKINDEGVVTCIEQEGSVKFDE